MIHRETCSWLVSLHMCDEMDQACSMCLPCALHIWLGEMALPVMHSCAVGLGHAVMFENGQGHTCTLCRPMPCRCRCSQVAACRTSSLCAGSAETDAMDARATSCSENLSLLAIAKSLACCAGSIATAAAAAAHSPNSATCSTLDRFISEKCYCQQPG